MSCKTFSSIKGSTKDAIEHVYTTLEQITGKLVVRTKFNNYRVYSDANVYPGFVTQVAENERIFHEVIFNGPQKLRFDIDASIDKLDAFTIPHEDELEELMGEHSHAEKFAHIINSLKGAIVRSMYYLYNVQLPEQSVIVCNSQDRTQKKYSAHIIVLGYYVANCRQAKAFCVRVLSKLPDEYSRLVDLGVYNTLQNFRMALCHKGDNRTKEVPDGVKPIDTLITYVKNCKELTSLPFEDAISTQKEITNETLTAALDMVKNELKHFTYRDISGGIISFDRIEPSHCVICDRTHHDDNSMYVILRESNGALAVIQRCRSEDKRAKIAGEKAQSKYLGAIGRIERMPGEAINAHIKETISAKYGGPAHTHFDTYCSRVIEYDEDKMRPFELAHTLVVRAEMGLGKTKSLIDYVQKYFNSKLAPSVIRIVTFRQTFSANIKEKFEDFDLYSEIKTPLISSDRLIIQVESLHRLLIENGQQPPDLLILDECESVFEQFDSGLLRGNFNECYAKFEYLVRYSKHVVCMDANLSNRTFAYLSSNRPTCRDVGNLVYHKNVFRPATDRTYYFTGTKSLWLTAVRASLENDERIVVPSNSMKEAKALHDVLVSEFPSKRFIMYSSETTPSEKREHFSDVHSYWSDVDCLIYTPTISAGVSYEDDHFDKMFAYFTDSSCSVETCHQMTGRVRAISSNEIYVYIEAHKNNLPTTAEEIKQRLLKNRYELGCGFNDTGITIEYANTGEMRYSGSSYFDLWAENTVVRNMSKNAFVRRIIERIKDTGARLEVLTTENVAMSIGCDNSECESIADYNESTHKTMKKTIESIRAKNIVKARELTDAEALDIKAQIEAQSDVSQENKLALERYKLQREYGPTIQLDESFVLAYNNTRMKAICRNLRQACARATLDEAWRAVQQTEQNTHNYLLATNEKGMDIGREYVFNKMRLISSALSMCGWDSLLSEKVVVRNCIWRLATSDEYWNVINEGCDEFAFSRPNRQRIVSSGKCVELIKPLNKMINAMFGARVADSKNTPDMFTIRRSKMFAYISGSEGNKPSVCGGDAL